MRKELDSYITRNYYQMLAIAKKYTKNDDWASELLHEVILQLYDKKELNIGLEDKDIKSYIIRCLMVNWCYPSSPFCRKVKRVIINEVELNEALSITDKESETNMHKMLELIEMEYSELNFLNKVLFEKYLLLGSMKKVSLDTNFSLGSVHKYINETKQTIKANTFKKFNNE